jgi:aminoglycoside phosphotransferase (APT) family kinase protein
MWAANAGFATLTLTTFDAIPWNRALYEHLGFAVLDESRLGPQMRELRATEASHGLDPRLRVVVSRATDGYVGVMNMHSDAQVDSDEALLRSLLEEQFPEWSSLVIRRMPSDGTDNAVYRIGDGLVARLPLIGWATAQVTKDHLWLPRLAPLLPLEIPEPIAIGRAGNGYPWHWAIHRWIEGENATPERLGDVRRALDDLVGFIRALRAVRLTDPPTCRRVAPLADDDERVRSAIAELADEFDAATLTAIWDAAIEAPRWSGPLMLVHGDLSDGNILVRDGRVAAVLDWSLFGLGEPANDLLAVWSLFADEGREAFRSVMDVDDATWARARGWAVASAIGITYYRDTNPGIVARARRSIRAVLDDWALR